MRYCARMAGSRSRVLGFLLGITVAFGQGLPEAEKLLQQERLQDAEALLQTLVKQAPADVEARFRLAYVHYRLRRLDLARQEFAAIVNAAPPAFGARYFLGRIALAEQNPREAIQWLRPVVQGGDTTHDAASQLAQAFVQAGQLPNALEPLQKAIQREPWDGRLYYRLGRLHQQLKQPELAREALQTSSRLLAAGRESVETLMAAGRELREGKRTEALQRLAPVANTAQIEPNILLATGILYTEMEEPQLALGVFERAARAAETLFAPQFNYGLALLKNGRPDEALPVLERAATLLPQSQEAQITLGLAAVMTRQYARAIAPLVRAYENEPGHTRVRSLLATAYLRTGKAEAAAKLLQPLVAEAGEPAPALLYIEALQALGQEQQAIATARTTYQKHPQDLAAAMTLGTLLTRAGQF
ncbi:MAG TPA: tetratricopeptide repeat protein, partial [Bryobacteraceae bacterium]|nr:tetratricopeptide repeat protein [Bryobacteraceae bacterium]